MTEVKVYELFPTEDEKFSLYAKDYNGRIIAVAAVSVKQAFFMAYSNMWADDPDNPLGIIWKYDKWRTDNNCQLFTGELCTDLVNIPRSDDDKKKIRNWMIVNI